MKQESGAGAARNRNEGRQCGAHRVNSTVNSTFVFAMYGGARRPGETQPWSKGNAAQEERAKGCSPL